MLFFNSCYATAFSWMEINNECCLRFLFQVKSSIEIQLGQGNTTQVRIQDLCKGGGSEILPTSRSGVGAAAKIWASKLGVGGGGASPQAPRRSAPAIDLFQIQFFQFSSEWEL